MQPVINFLVGYILLDLPLGCSLGIGKNEPEVPFSPEASVLLVSSTLARSNYYREPLRWIPEVSSSKGNARYSNSTLLQCLGRVNCYQNDIIVSEEATSRSHTTLNYTFFGLQYAAALLSSSTHLHPSTSVLGHDLVKIANLAVMLRTGGQKGGGLASAFGLSSDRSSMNLRTIKSAIRLSPKGDRVIRSQPSVIFSGARGFVVNNLQNQSNQTHTTQVPAKLMDGNGKLRDTSSECPPDGGSSAFVGLSGQGVAGRRQSSDTNGLKLTGCSAVHTEAVETSEQLIHHEHSNLPKNFNSRRLPRLEGTAAKGPRLAQAEWAMNFCKSLRGNVYGYFTRPRDSQIRQRIRESLSRVEQGGVVFPIGIPEDGDQETVYNELLAEQAKHQDLIIGHYYDHYFTLSSKTVMLFKWFEGCHAVNPELNWLIKVDSDVVPHYKVMESVLNDILENGVDGNITPHDEIGSRKLNLRPQSYPFLIGHVFQDGSPIVPKDPDHRNYDDINIVRYPRYCSGGLYVVSPTLVSLVLTTLLKPELSNVYFRNEDAMIGIALAVNNEARTTALPIYPFDIESIYATGLRYTRGVCVNWLYIFTFSHYPFNCVCSKVFAISAAELELDPEYFDRCEFEEHTVRAAHLNIRLSSYSNRRIKFPKKLKNGFGKNAKARALLRGLLVIQDD